MAVPLHVQRHPVLLRVTRVAGVALVIALLQSTAVQAGVRLRVVAVRADVPPQPIVLVIRTAEGERTLQTNTGAEVEIDDPAPFTVVATEPWWSAPIAVSDTPAVEIPVWPAAELRGRLSTEKGVDPPRQLEATFALKRAGTTDRISITCPVERSGAWRCRLPESPLDVRLATAGLAPHYLWDLALSRERVSTVAPFTLKRGGSVAGWVEASGTVAEGAVVRLAPAVYGGATEDVRLRSYEQKANRRGFFQFTGVPAGRWVASAEAPGFSPSVIAEVRVDDRNESTLSEALMLRELVDVHVRITPRRYAAGRPWTIRLQRYSMDAPHGTTVAESEAGDDGTWSFHAAAVGNYRLYVMSPGGAVLAGKQIPVEPGIQPLEIAIGAVPVEGRVRIGGEGVAARVKLQADGGETLTFTSDAHGQFRATLPSEGTWHADVRLLATSQELRRETVEVRRVEGEPHARVDLDFPGGHLTGRVVDEKGKPVRAGVVVTRNASPLADIVADEGIFEIRGLERGPAQIQAGTEELSSGGMAVVVDEQTAPLTLVVRGRNKVEGRLTTAGGEPVAGAAIRYFTPAAWHLSETVSGPSGRFVLDVGPDAEVVNVAIIAAGHPAKLVLLPVPERGRRLDIILGGPNGRLIVPIRERTPPWPVLRRRGAWASLVHLIPPFHAADATGFRTKEGMVLDLESGEYAVCATHEPSSPCVQQIVVAGATAVVDTPRRNAVADKERQ